MKNNYKNRIEECFFVLDFETDRLSSGGKEEYIKLKIVVKELLEMSKVQDKIITDLYNKVKNRKE